MPGISGPGAVTRSTLRQQIADALRDEVLAGRLQPGQEFTVKEIAEQYGVSATPVREALVDLSAQGLLEADQHRGFRVHEYSPADFVEMIEARGLVVDGMFRSLVERSEDTSPTERSEDTSPTERSEGTSPTERSEDTSLVERSEDTAAEGSGTVGSPTAAAPANAARPAAAPEAGAAPAAPALPRTVPPRLRPPLDPRTAAKLAGVRRRGEEAQRAAGAGDLTVLIGYDLRFWRELSALFGNAYLADFLHRLRVRCWVCAVQQLRRLDDLRGLLWSGHTELVDALARGDIPAARALVAAHHAHSLSLVGRSAGA
ncbi:MULTISPECIES: GntR family transcriptional regulator [unclassified Streptomyces]|uniref:GntR family transcriptional regulator n=1 Tax=unclassified Streptomyces TaxID=2593676 RepID=UPI00036660A7|nr:MULTISPECIES: GntR family transcriptional regulator [unclassified Streptomyces]MYX25225.1 GntR family transcriptional regulator [Streptomyces sp. SID8381]